MFPYQPKPWHLITVSLPLFAIGTLAISMGDVTLDQTDPWEIFGWILLFMGFVSIGMIALSLIWNNASEHNKSKQYMMDSAKHLSLDQMAAIGLTVGDPQRTTSIRITNTDHNDTMQQIRYINNLPISPVKLQAMASALIDGAPFSRREWVERKSLLSDGEFRKLQDELIKQGLLAQKNINDPRSGYELTKVGTVIMRKYAVPSPTPNTEMAKNDI